MDCDAGEVCRAVGGVLQCVRPDLVPDPGMTCGTCPPPNECRGGVCVTPSGSGAVCEFDTECGDDLCIAGRCTPDPRGRPPCTTAGTCPGSLMCTAGVCTCAHSVDCPIGAICEGGACTTPGGCLADRECAATDVCEGALCIPRTTCDIVPPDLTGVWSLASTLRLRESLPSWLDTLLSLVSGPFRFIAGDSTTLGLGLPGWVESIIAPAMRDWADTHLAPWARDLLGGIADLNDILSTWSIDERMELMPGVALDTYTGTHEWLRVRFDYRGMPVEGRPEDIIGWEFTPSEFDALVVCGEFEIDRHDVHVSISSIVAWAVNLVTYEATGHRYTTLHDALTAVTAGFCGALADAAQAAIGSSYSVRGVVDSACNTAVTGLIDSVTHTIDDATVGADVMTLKGHAPIVGPNRMSPGVWEGTLAGRDFTGDFDASR
jgi:hypothetical protein